MSDQQLVHYITVTREIAAPIGEVWGIVAAFGGEKTWYPGCKKLSLEGFGIGSVRRFEYEYVFGKNKGQEYVFTEEMTAVDAENHSMSFKVERPDYPGMFAIGTTVLDEISPTVTRFRWIGNGSPIPEEGMKELVEDLNERLNGLIDAIASYVV